MLKKAYFLPVVTAIALSLNACGPETSTKPTPVPTSKLATAKQFASEIYTATSGLQDLMAADGPMEQLANDMDIAADVYDASLDDALLTLNVASAAVVNISLKAFTEWDGSLENPPTSYDIDYSKLEPTYNLLTDELTLLDEVLNQQSEYSELTLTAGTVTWNNATKRMEADIELTSDDGQKTSFNAIIELPASMSGNRFTFKLVDAELENQRTTLTFDQQPAVVVSVDFYENMQFNTDSYVEVDELNNPYLKLKSISIATSTMNLDMDGGSRDVHFDGKGNITLVRSQQTNDANGYLILPTELSVSGNFQFGQAHANGRFDFALANVDDVYLTNEKALHLATSAEGAPDYRDPESYITYDYDSASKTLTIEATDLIGYLSEIYTQDGYGYNNYNLVSKIVFALIEEGDTVRINQQFFDENGIFIDEDNIYDSDYVQFITDRELYTPVTMQVGNQSSPISISFYIDMSFDFTLEELDSEIWNLSVSTEFIDEFQNFDDATMNLSFSTEFQASAQSPLIGISSTLTNFPIGSVFSDILEEDLQSITQSMDLTYNQNTYHIAMDYDNEQMTIANNTGNAVLNLNMDSETESLGTIKVDGVKQADIVETDLNIEAVFIDGTKQVLTSF